MNAASDAAGKLLFVTGATGLVGTHTVRLLAERGFRLRCLVRPTSNRSRLPQQLELVEGHLLDKQVLNRAVEGCEGVLHIGGVIKVKKTSDFYRINGEATALLAEAANRAGVKRFVLVSSQAAAGPAANSGRRSTTDRPAPVTAYGRSKLAGEQALAEKSDAMWWNIIRPPAVYGPEDYAFLPLVKAVKRGFKLRLGKPIRFSLIHAADLAQALLLTLTSDLPSGGIWYATDGREHDDGEMTQLIAEALGVRAVTIVIPRWSAYGIAALLETWGKLTGSAVLLSRDKVLEISQRNYTCDDRPFREATGFANEYSLREGLAETVQWYIEKGLI